MEKQLKQQISKELEQFHCSILLDEVKEKVRKLKAYGVEDAEIMAAMNEEELFPQLIVTEDFKIVLAGERPIEVDMEPLVKAVYLLFLSHPEGIVLKNLPDYREELTSIYLLLRPAGMTSRVEKSIMDVTNPNQNSINEKCARIRKLFSEILPETVARYYAISGKRGEVKKIDLVHKHGNGVVDALGGSVPTVVGCVLYQYLPVEVEFLRVGYLHIINLTNRYSP